MLGHLSLDILFHKVSLELRSGKTVSFSEQVMSTDKHHSIFCAKLRLLTSWCAIHHHLVSSVGRAPVCCAGDQGFEPQTGPTHRVLKYLRRMYCLCNSPHSIYQYSNMALRLSGQTSIFGIVFFVSKFLLGIERRETLNIYNFDLKASQPC